MTCWFKLACLLYGSGHRVSCIDLAGSLLVDPNTVRSFDEYDAPLVEFMAALPDGHKGDDHLSVLSNGAPDLSEFGDVYDLNFGLGEDHPPTSMVLRKEFQRTILYQQSSQEDSTLASILLRPFPAVLHTGRFGCVDDGVKSPVNALHCVYIKTVNDRTLKAEQQEAMIHRWPPRKVMVMDTDHSPFFSAPDHLLELILKSL
ncbi:methylesterase 17-like [Panicum miliaceum]|uniref:Methylesterase 17-like n=1 Tax=Panicum miliaceum TaxID=4540 RepID=A0A3L6Q0I0_PANMI|nr:methylesterase 17-like [Panicum miliaceum]